MLFRELFPHAGEVEIEDYIRALDLGAAAAEDRPRTVANFVASLDGRATVEGRSGGLGDDGDKALFGALRGAADAILVGTGTLRAERYGRLLSDPGARARRRAAGLASEPLACILSRSGRLPLAIPLFAEPEARVLVFSSQDIDLAGVAAQAELVRLPPAELSFAAALAHLRTQRDVKLLLCEGGPTVFATLLRERVVDELFLTLAPKLLGGGDGAAITTGPALERLAEVALAGALERAGTLFLRYRYGLGPTTL